MARKAKAKAKGKAGKGGDEAAPMVEVPPPPPEPMCVAFPEHMVDKYAVYRCLLLSWADPLGQYKLQMRPYIPGELLDRLGTDQAWVDVKDKERLSLQGRPAYQTWRVSCEHVRLQYRLVSERPAVPIDGLYVANWSSAPSEPVSSYVDPPMELTGELCYESDIMPPSVSLNWTCANMECLRRVMGEGAQLNEHGPFASWPGMLPIRVQVRWRVVRPLSGVDALPPAVANGKHFTSGPIDNLRREAFFDFRNEAWRMTYREVVHGIVARFSVRLGTSFRWSPWSEESDDIEVEVPEPSPLGLQAVREQPPMEDPGSESRESDRVSTCLEVHQLCDREAELWWPPFMLAGSLTAIEYRVTLCQLEHEDEAPPWDARGIVLKTIILQKQADHVSTSIQHLHPDTWYVVRVDARYPYVGKRQFSSGKALCPRFRTPFPTRPPLQPLPALVAENLLSQDDEDLTQEGDLLEQLDEEAANSGSFDWETSPWVPLRVERNYLPDYSIEFMDATAPVLKPMAPRHDTDAGGFFEAWRKTAIAVVQRAEASGLRKNPDSSECGSDNSRWCIVRVGFGESVPEVVTCRLMHRGAIATVSPLRWTVVTPPVVPLISPVSFVQPAAWTHVSDEGIRLVLRFFLHPGATSFDEYAAHMTTTNITARRKLSSKPGHRFVTRYQVRFAAERQSSQQEDWITLEPSLLPPASQPHTVVASKGRASLEDLFHEAMGLDVYLGWPGIRYEVGVALGSNNRLRVLLQAGASYVANVRVGNEYRWSNWEPVPTRENLSVDESLTFSFPIPSPTPGAQLDCTPQSATRLALSWVPFDRYPGITRINYVVCATPLFDEAKHEAGIEGAEVVERTFPRQHTARMTMDELLAGREARSLLDDSRDFSLRKLSAIVDAERKRERDEDQKQEERIMVELAGLLPCTRYDVRVSAMYPTAAVGEAVGDKLSLSVLVDMPGGEAPPHAPQAAALNSGDDMEPTPEARKVLLRIEDRPGYILEYRAAEAGIALYEPRSSSLGPSSSEFGGSWQQGHGPWRCVSSTVPVATPPERQDDNWKVVWAELPGFESNQNPKRYSSNQVNDIVRERVPDVVEFRLCTTARSAAHPCRWAGGVSCPMAVCFAPPRRPPKVRRVLSDDRWCFSLTVELFKTAPAPVPIKLLSAATDDDDDDGDNEEEDDDREFAELRQTHVVPRPAREAWAGSGVGRIPIGYGHRTATVVEFRYSLQSGMTPQLRKQLEDNTLSSVWQTSPVVPIEPESLSGERCTLEVGSGLGLLEGGIYMFQVRVGDGCRWSTWSHTSNAFAFRVPPPSPPSAVAIGTQQAVTVEIVSSTVARVRWCDFRPAPGLVLLEYEVRAEPQQVSHCGPSTCSPVSAYFEHRYRGGWIEREVPNLLPFTPYVFFVRARYPRVGSRDWWTEPSQVSDPVTLEHPMAAQDPPTPFAVLDLEERETDEDSKAIAKFGGELDASGGARSVTSKVHSELGMDNPGRRSVTLAFPDEEDGAHYDLQYAHVLGDEQDTSHLRASQCLWHSPVDVTLMDSAGVVSGELSRWRVHLPDLGAFRSEPLKLALLQRVRFRLQARFASEASTTRWWSSLSAPIATGFAGPDSALAMLVAAGDRLTVEVQFSLDWRLADAVAVAGITTVRAQCTELDTALQEESQTSSGDRSGMMPSSGANGQPAWPRGFGHPFVTRYQLRVRYQARKPDSSAAAGVGGGDVTLADGAALPIDAGAPSNVEWGPWEVQPDVTLPKESDRGSLGAARFARVANPQARWYSVEVPQMRCRAVAPGDVVQSAVRIGDGIKWSAWRVINEVSIVVPAPRAANEVDMAEARWVGDVCTVKWPSAAGPIGLDTIEYQLMVEPDSNVLKAHIGAVLITPAASSRRDDTQLEGAASGIESGRKSRTAQGTWVQTPELDKHKQSGAPEALAPTQPSPETSRSAKHTSIKQDWTKEQVVSVELRDLCTDLRYGFTVLARYPTVGPRAFTKIFQVPKVAWRPSSFARPMDGAVGIARATDYSATFPPPMLEQIPAPEDGRLRKWCDSRFVLLTWPSLEVCDDQLGPMSMRYQIQVSEVSRDISVGSMVTSAIDTLTAGEAGDDIDNIGAGDASHRGRVWQPCENTTPLNFDGLPCVAAWNLPLFVGQFRLFDTVQERAGPVTWPIATIYETRSPAPVAEMQALGKGAPRSLGVRLTFSLSALGGTQLHATRCQVCFRPLGSGVDSSVWEESEPTALYTSGGDDVSILVREEDGLELGPAYEFAVRVGDKCRLGAWSAASRPLKFAVSPPVPQGSSSIQAVVEAEKAELSWPAFQPEALLATKMPGFAKLPMEYIVTVFGGSDHEPVTVFITRDIRATVRMLVPSTAYSAMVSARWTRFCTSTPEIKLPGNGTSLRTSLMAAFVTAQLQKQTIAEMSVPLPSDMATPTVANLPLDSSGPEAITFDLDPYHASVQQPNLPHVFARKPPVPAHRQPSPRRLGMASREIGVLQAPANVESLPLAGRKLLPTLVPMPPPKFTTREPLTFAPLLETCRGSSSAGAGVASSQRVPSFPGRTKVGAQPSPRARPAA